MRKAFKQDLSIDFVHATIFFDITFQITFLLIIFCINSLLNYHSESVLNNKMKLSV